jgi:hypothetical protein
MDRAKAASAEETKDSKKHKGDAHSDDHAEMAKEDVIVEIGRVLVPIYKPRSIDYVVAVVDLSISDDESAKFLNSDVGAEKAKADILYAMMKLTTNPILDAKSIDSAELSSILKEVLQKDYVGLEKVMFSSLSKTSIERG